MKLSQNILNLVLLALVAVMIVGMALTARAPRPPRGPKSRRSAMLAAREMVDQTPLDTARALAPLASTSEERALAANAVRLADHEVDLAFTAALRTASKTSSARTNPHIQDRIDRAQDQIARLKNRIQQLTSEASHAPPSRQTNLQGDIALAQAQLDLAQNELADAQEDMARQGGGLYAQIQRLWAEHQATEHVNGKTRVSTTPASPVNGPTVSAIARWKYWTGLRSKRRQLAQARAQVTPKISALTKQHNAIQQHVQEEQAQKSGNPQAPSGSPQAARPGAKGTENTAMALAEVQRLSQDEAALAPLDQRIQDLHDLSKVYDDWTALVTSRQRAAMNLLLRSAFWIFLVLLIVSVAGSLINQFFDRVRLDRKQKMTLRGVVRFTVQVIGVLVILIVIFGSPSHMSTVLGLLGAGLAVALKSFVVSFFGWFVLMGRNGIQVGDWVEINGVRGEVLEIGLLRTILLETGNWTDPGHPTGRQVAFLNNYAVEGYYFNFSTSGQWLWDQFALLIPAGRDPYASVEAILALVKKETADTRAAGAEWQRVARRCGVRSFSAEPEINVKPTDSGVQLVVRYVTRANERYEVRNRLNHAIVKLFQPSKSVRGAPLPSVEFGPTAEPVDGSRPAADETPERPEPAAKRRT